MTIPSRFMVVELECWTRLAWLWVEVLVRRLLLFGAESAGVPVLCTRNLALEVCTQ